MGLEAEKFEIEFRQFVSSFPGAPAVAVQEGYFRDVSIFLSRINCDLREKFLRGWADAIRARIE